MGSDCSERVCFYAHAFIDTPLGDLNADGKISMSVTYEEQTLDYNLEGYPIAYGSARNIDKNQESERWDEAHFYRECSNKGICNRKTGQCDCFPGYEGEGCQRTTCPGTSAGITCSGHGLCLSAYHDLGDWYTLWDKEKTMKCQCDAGYTGPDCSLRTCPQGPDPVKHSDKVTTSLQKIAWGSLAYNQDFQKMPGAFNTIVSGPVHWTVTVTDDYGDEWTTNTLTVDYHTDCSPRASTQACYSKPIFNPADSHTDGEDHPESFDWYATATIADSLNNSLHALPNGAVDSPYVWMWYTGDATVIDIQANGAARLVCQTSDNCVDTDTEYAFTRDTANTGDIKYPEADTIATATDTVAKNAGYSGQTTFWNSPRTRYPDFNSLSDPDKKWWDCGRIDNKEDVNVDGAALAGPGRISASALTDARGDKVVSAEGLCLYISSNNKIVTNYVVTYSYAADIFTDATDAVAVYEGQTQIGTSVSVHTKHLATGVQGWGPDVGNEETAPSNLINGLVPLVTVEEVGLYRYWDVNVDGYPALTYAKQDSDVIGDNTLVSTYEADPCSKRGLCNLATGVCQCFSGYTGVACSAQNAIAYS
jgi:hypothetical protein